MQACMRVHGDEQPDMPDAGSPCSLHAVSGSPPELAPAIVVAATRMLPSSPSACTPEELGPSESASTWSWRLESGGGTSARGRGRLEIYPLSSSLCGCTVLAYRRRTSLRKRKTSDLNSLEGGLSKMCVRLKPPQPSVLALSRITAHAQHQSSASHSQPASPRQGQKP